MRDGRRVWMGAVLAAVLSAVVAAQSDGVDVTMGYRVALAAAGDVRLHAGYNNTRTKIVGTVTTENVGRGPNDLPGRTKITKITKIPKAHCGLPERCGLCV